MLASRVHLEFSRRRRGEKPKLSALGCAQAPRLNPATNPHLWNRSIFCESAEFATHHSRPCFQRQSGEVGGHAVPQRDFPTPVGSDEPFQAKIFGTNKTEKRVFL